MSRSRAQSLTLLFRALHTLVAGLISARPVIPTSRHARSPLRDARRIPGLFNWRLLQKRGWPLGSVWRAYSGTLASAPACGLERMWVWARSSASGGRQSTPAAGRSAACARSRLRCASKGEGWRPGRELGLEREREQRRPGYRGCGSGEDLPPPGRTRDSEEPPRAPQPCRRVSSVLTEW